MELDDYKLDDYVLSGHKRKQLVESEIQHAN